MQVAEDQQSLAIGRGGQNVRLAARLTGWKIDIRSTGGQQIAGTEEGGAVAEKTPEPEIVEEAKEKVDEKLADIAGEKEEMEDEMDAAEPAPETEEKKEKDAE